MHIGDVVWISRNGVEPIEGVLVAIAMHPTGNMAYIVDLFDIPMHSYVRYANNIYTSLENFENNIPYGVVKNRD